MHAVSLLACCLLSIVAEGFGRSLADAGTPDTETWTGRWLPDRTTNAPPVKHDFTDPNHGVVMGIPTDHCDDAKTNLTIDWDGSAVDYTCYSASRIWPDVNISPYIEQKHIPQMYSALHYCMDEKIEYDDVIPTFGPHRPLWARYGEYKYLPRQRWVHNLEHGGVVMLYHPCAHPEEVKKLRNIVKGCLWRHIITPYAGLDENQPLALVTWGFRMTMAFADPAETKAFIKKTALRGPEQVHRDGQFDEELLEPAQIVSDETDSNLCP